MLVTVWWARPSVRPASEGTVEASDCVRRMPPPRGGMSPTPSPPSLPFTKDCIALYNEIPDTSIEYQIHNRPGKKHNHSLKPNVQGHICFISQHAAMLRAFFSL